MTNNEFEIIQKAYEILDKLTDDETIESANNFYWHRLNESRDSIALLVDFMSNNKEKLVKDF